MDRASAVTTRAWLWLWALAASACASVPPAGGGGAADPSGTFQGHRYVWTQAAGNWEQVEEEAVRMGGHLVAIDSAEENEFLVRTFGDGSYWIGLVQTPRSPEPRQGWHWADGSPLTYVHWAGGQPDNSTGKDDYGFFLKGWQGKWGDVPVEGWPATSSYRGVVELPR